MTLKRELQSALEATLLRGASFDAGAFMARIEDRPGGNAAAGTFDRGADPGSEARDHLPATGRQS